MHRCRLADLQFAPTETSRKSLLSENVHDQNIIVTGKTVIDELHEMVGEARGISQARYKDRGAVPSLEDGRRTNLVTGHRRKCFVLGFENSCHAQRKIGESSDTKMVYPVHLNPNVQAAALRHHLRIRECRDCQSRLKILQPWARVGCIVSRSNYETSFLLRRRNRAPFAQRET